MKAPLVDKEGFPLAGVDIMSVRTMRSKLIHLKNDHTSIMKEIDAGLEERHDMCRTQAAACHVQRGGGPDEG